MHSGDISRVDVWTGGLMETQPEGPGELFREIIRDQFERIRDADRFWYENRDNGFVNYRLLIDLHKSNLRFVANLFLNFTSFFYNGKLLGSKLYL